jgi:hypothetical protein
MYNLEHSLGTLQQLTKKAMDVVATKILGLGEKLAKMPPF